jgi:hypothetical protein
MSPAVPPAIWRLAQRVLVHEAARSSSAGSIDNLVQVCDKLRVPITKLAGPTGFRMVLTRAKALASTDEPWLDSVQVLPDGALAIPEETKRDIESRKAAEQGTGLVAQFLGLLVTFIGEPLTVQLVRQAWPDLGAEETDRDSGVQP